PHERGRRRIRELMSDVKLLPEDDGLNFLRQLRHEKQAAPKYRVVRKRVASLKPSPENEKLYRPVSEDPDLKELVDSIAKNGLLEMLIVTADNYIVSGHRRHMALVLLGRVFVSCRVLPVRRDAMTADEYLALLR